MSIVQVPRILALDTAALAMWAHHCGRGDSIAFRLLEVMKRSNTRILLTLHHVVELLGHDSDDLLEARAQFVQKLEQLFWVRMQNGTSLGGVLDLHALEIRARLDDPSASLLQLVSRVRQDAIAFGDSSEALQLMREPALIESSRRRVRNRRVVASIARTKPSDPTLTEHPVVPANCDVSLATVLARFDEEELHLESQLKAVGDRGVSRPDSVARQFFSELRENAISVAVAGKVNLGHLLGKLGVQDSDLSHPTSARQLGDRYVWKRQSSVLAKVAGVPHCRVETLRRSDMPSTYLSSEISVVQSTARAEGGNVDDASLACLSFYAAVTSVDKRTAEAVRQVRRRRAELDGAMGKVVKIPSLEALETVLTSLA